MKYTAINIGPIVQTLGMARKPRELWAASYLFSHLMKCIIEKFPKEKVISPALLGKDEKNGIGLYPDRVFIKDEISYSSIKPSIDSFAEHLKLSAGYFNVMVVSGDYTKDSEAIKDLNGKLDCLELFNRSVDKDSVDVVRKLIVDDNWHFMNYAFAKDDDKPTGTLAEYAAAELQNLDAWKEFQKEIQKDNDKEAFKKFPKDRLKSYHKYICVVQADGDNVGKTVSHQGLSDGKVEEISKALLQFGKNAKKAIDDFGGLPIYAGGDDLLFVAPVVGKDGGTILDLLDKLNDESFGCVKSVIDPLNLKDKDNKAIKASLSFGVSISYYKYPLYEALESARNLLFGRAKNIKGKNAIALDLRKHSGGSFYMELSKNNSEMKDKFNEMIVASGEKESVVSAVSHKIRSNEGLLKLWIEDAEADKSARNENFFKKYMEYNSSNPDAYKKATLELMNELCLVENDAEKLVKTMYGMLRIAKFIKGEEVIDE